MLGGTFHDHWERTNSGNHHRAMHTTMADALIKRGLFAEIPHCTHDYNFQRYIR